MTERERGVNGKETADEYYLHSNSFSAFDDRYGFAGMDVVLSDEMALEITNSFD